jgi:hypothetical protein
MKIQISHRNALKLEASTNIFISSTHNICEYNGLTHKTILAWEKKGQEQLQTTLTLQGHLSGSNEIKEKEK